MDNIHSLIYKHIVDGDKPEDECDKLLIFIISLRQSYIDNDKPVIPVGDDSNDIIHKDSG